MHGAAILTGPACTLAAVLEAAGSVLGPRARHVACQFGPVEGYAFGREMPDYLFQPFVAQSGGEDGESVLLDGQALLDGLDTVRDRELLRFLWEVPVAKRHPSGRLQVLHHRFQSPSPTSGDPKDDRKLLARWSEVVMAAADEDPGFRLEPGEILCVDNFRVMHTHKAHADDQQELFLAWAWTEDAMVMRGWRRRGK